MNRSIVTAAAFAAALAVAAPLSAYSQNQPPPAPNQPAEPQQVQPPASAQPGGAAGGSTQGGQPMMGRGMGGMMGRGMGGMGMGMGMMGHGAEMMGHGGRHGFMHRGTAQHCRDRLARRAAMVAYVVTELDLNPQQQQAWNQVRNVLEQGLQREQQLCNALQPASQNAPENILDLLNLREQVLQTQLQTLQHARPALQQLYGSLNARQKEIINHAVGRG